MRGPLPESQSRTGENTVNRFSREKKEVSFCIDLFKLVGIGQPPQLISFLPIPSFLLIFSLQSSFVIMLVREVSSNDNLSFTWPRYLKLKRKCFGIEWEECT